MSKSLYRAKYIYPVSQSIIEDGAILVENGKIVKIDYDDDFTDDELTNTEMYNYPGGLILPGLINSHTHLEYTALGKLSPKSFVDFLLQSMEKTAGWNENKIKDSIRMGIKQSIECGVTTIADVSRWGMSPMVLSEYPLLADVAIEAYSFDAKSSEEVFKKLVGKIDYIKSKINKNVRISISPHSPYNCDPALWEKIIAYTAENNMLIHTHLAESLDEKKWFEYGDSEIDTLHNLLGWPKITPQITSMSSVEFLATLQLIPNNMIAAHLCYASLRDLELLEDRNAGMVICPRSNFNLHQKILDYNLLRHLKIKALLATDGSTSSGNLNILEDIRLYGSKFQLPFEELTKMVTLYPAKHLKLDHLVGSLAPGKLANMIVFDHIDTPSNWYNHNKPAEVIIEGNSALAKLQKNML